MIVLDTNVLSELMRPSPDAAVLDWFKRTPAAMLHTTAITQAEIFHGIARMTAGKRRNALTLAAQEMFETDFRDKVLPFDSEAAVSYATLLVQRERAGSPMATFDAQIAAITLVAGAALATRNVKDFARCGVTLIDPWTA